MLFPSFLPAVVFLWLMPMLFILVLFYVGVGAGLFWLTSCRGGVKVLLCVLCVSLIRASRLLL